ncbi:MAG: ABC transporter permease [Lachnospiraceae bacterium]|jgi:spermidine/putrescine transport system permease protein
MASKKKKDKTSSVFLAPLYIFTIIFVFLPFVYMVYLSFMTRAKVWGFENQFTLDNYARIFEPMYLGTFLDSLKLALISTSLVVIIGYAFGYFMAKQKEKVRNILMLLLMIPFWTSALIRLNGWIIVFRSNGILDSILMGCGITESPLKMLYSYPMVVFGMVYELLPFMILCVYSSAEKLDWSLIEASRDLGAGSVRTFFNVTLRQTVPGLLSGIVLTFIPSMGLFFISELLGGNKIVLIGNVIQQQMTKGRNLPFAAALSVVMMILTSLFIALYKKMAGSDMKGGII